MFISRIIFSSLTRRILLLNLTALFFAVAGAVYLGDFRNILVENKVKYMLAQQHIVARAIFLALDNKVNVNNHVNLTKKDLSPALIDIFKDLALQNKLYLRLYDNDQNLLYDNQALYDFVIPKKTNNLLDNLANWLFSTENIYPNFKDSTLSQNHIANSLKGKTCLWSSRNIGSRNLFLNISMPLLHEGKIYGVILLADFSDDIENIIKKININILLFSIGLVGIFIFMSLYLSYNITTPLHRLSIAAQKASLFTNPPTDIPRFSRRFWEFNQLAVAIKRMMAAFYNHLESMAAFAQDVSHELKNPLSSLSSALEALKYARSAEQIEQLHNIMLQDIKRMNLLISDISDSSRIDAQLAKESYKYIDLYKMLEQRANWVNNNKQEKAIKFSILPQTNKDSSYMIYGHELRIMQLFDNLIANAISFVPSQNGQIKFILSEQDNNIVVKIKDNGPGIKAKNIARIFERFYTEREIKDEFGKNSGLGLAIAQQIAQLHHGKIYAENIVAEGGEILGACFTVMLPKINA